MVSKVSLLILLALLDAQALAQVPPAAMQYRSEMVRSAYRIHGPGAPIATLAAQIHAESAWNCNAVSWAGAQGCGQFMPGTSDDAAKRWPEDCAPANPFSPRWAFSCRDRYMQSLKPKTMAAGLTECDDIAFRLRAYNGGLGWIRKDRSIAAMDGSNPDSWRSVQPYNSGRRESAYRENTMYPEKIFKLESLYKSWGRSLDC